MVGFAPLNLTVRGRADKPSALESGARSSRIAGMAELSDDWNPIPMIEDALAEVLESIREDGGFAPFAITVDDEGNTDSFTMRAVDDSGDFISDFQAIVDTLQEDAEAGDHAAVAIVSDVWVRNADGPEKRDAVTVHLEFRDGYARKFIFFYEFEERPGDGKDPYHVELREAEIQPADPMIFDPA
ncbi:MAG: hypothetical protein RLT05_16525 [Bauldia litoralis]